MDQGSLGNTVLSDSDHPSSTPDGWRPIETAPTRRKVLVSWLDALGKRRTTCACYFGAGELDMDDSYTDSDSDGADEDGKNADAGWFEERETGDPGYYELREPLTHWMPLPPAPGEAPSADARSAVGKIEPNDTDRLGVWRAWARETLDEPQSTALDDATLRLYIGQEITAEYERAEAAKRIVASIATMMGWLDAPPQRMLEAAIAALKARAEHATELEAKLEAAEAERDVWRAQALTRSDMAPQLMASLQDAEAEIRSLRSSLLTLVEKWREFADKVPRQIPHLSQAYNECADELEKTLTRVDGERLSEGQDLPRRNDGDD